jgi:hypothetical protein
VTDVDVEQRWAQRLERERKARRQAEKYAEQGLRELWLANQQLEAAVNERKAELDRSLAALDHASHMRRSVLAGMARQVEVPAEALTELMADVDPARLPADLADALSRARTLAAEVQRQLTVLAAAAHVDERIAAGDVYERDPQSVIDDLVHRWQLPTARRGKLLSPEVRGSDRSVSLAWEPLIGAADAILDGAAQHSEGGALHVELVVTDSDVVLTITDSGLHLPPGALHEPTPSPLHWASIGRRGIGLAVAQRMIDGTACQLRVSQVEGGTRAEIRSARPQRL